MAERVEYDIQVNTEEAKASLDSLAAKIGLSVVSAQELVGAVKRMAGAIVEFAQESVQEWANYELAVSRLDSVLKATGGTVGYTTQELADMASEMQNVTMYGDDVTVNAMAIMATFDKINRDTFPRAVSLAQDLATVFNIDLQSATLALGKALDDPAEGFSALRRMGVRFTEEQKKVIEAMMQTNDVAGAQKVILDELAGRFEGAAKAAGDTMAGKLAQLNNAFGDLKKTIGSMVTEALRPAIEALTEFLQWLNQAISGTNQLREMTKNWEGPRITSRDQLNKLIEQNRANAGEITDLSKYWQTAPGASKQAQAPVVQKPVEISPEEIARREKLLRVSIQVADEYARLAQEAENFAEEVKEEGLTYEQLEPYIQMADELQRMANEAENYTGRVDVIIERTYTWNEAMVNIENSMIRTLATGFVDSMRELGELTYRAGLSAESLGEAIGNLSYQILQALPNMFLQAGLMAIAMGNIPLGMALIGMAGVAGFAAGAASAAVQEDRTQRSVMPSMEQKTVVNVTNNTGAYTETKETTAADGTKIVEVIVGQVGQAMARGEYDNILTSRYGIRYGGVRS